MALLSPAVGSRDRRPLHDRPALQVALLLVGFTVAVALRVAAGGMEVSRSAGAGLLFACLLLALSALALPLRPGTPAVTPTPRHLVVGLGAGLAGAAALCAAPALHRWAAVEGHRPGGSFAGWAVVVAIVAAAEEIFLRGTLYRAVRPAGPAYSIGVTAVAFGLLHVTLYGWEALPLDIAVGAWLGVLRELTGGVTAPATAHVLADWAGWWLR